MSRRPNADRAGAVRGEALRERLAVGDHRGAAQEARRTLADPAAHPAAREASQEALASLRPEPGAVVIGLSGVLLAAAIVLWTVLAR